MKTTGQNYYLGKNLNYFKAQASILLKQIRQADIIIDSSLRHRLYQCSQQKLLAKPDKVKLKDALNIIAMEQGFSEWCTFKQAVDVNLFIDFKTFFGRSEFGGFINHWYKSYDEAKLFQQLHGGVLLPYKQHFFVSELNFIERLGFKILDSDWQAIGYDWVNPKSQQALKSIVEKLAARWAVN